MDVLLQRVQWGQKEIAKQITEQGGDYVFCVKGNQGNMHKDKGTIYQGAEGGIQGI